MTRVHEIKSEIGKLTRELNQIQDMCEHTDKIKLDDGSCGDLGDGDKVYWSRWSCPTCLRQWTKHEDVGYGVEDNV